MERVQKVEAIKMFINNKLSDIEDPEKLIKAMLPEGYFLALTDGEIKHLTRLLIKIPDNDLSKLSTNELKELYNLMKKAEDSLRQ